jgi:hypothetical protein
MLLFLSKTLLTAPTMSSFMHCLQSVYGDQILSRGLWMPCLLGLTYATFTYEGMLKGKVHSRYPYTEERKQRSECSVVSFTFVTLTCVCNMFMQLKETLCNTFFKYDA